MPRPFSFARFFSSMKFFRGASAKTRGSGGFAEGTLIVVRPTRLAYQTVTDASPRPSTVARPAASTRTTVSSVLANLAQRVTSADRPSEYVARTRIGWMSPGRNRAESGKTVNERIFASAPEGAVVPAAIHSARTRYSSESAANRTPPPWSRTPVGLSSIRLSAGASC